MTTDTDRAREEATDAEYEDDLGRSLDDINPGYWESVPPVAPEVQAILDRWRRGSAELPWNDAGPGNNQQRGRGAMAAVSKVTGAVRRFAHWAGIAGRTCRFLWTVRAAIPWPVRVILAAAMLIKCLPLDFGVDETLTVIAALILQRTRPGLLKACYRAAQIRA